MFSLVTVGFFQILGITVTVTCVWQRLKGIQESGSGKGPSPGILWLEVIGIEKPEVGLTRSSASYVTDLGIGMGFLWMVVNWKHRQKKTQKTGKLAVTKSWVFQTDCCQGCSLVSFPKTRWLPQFMGQSSIVMCHEWVGIVFTFNVSRLMVSNNSYHWLTSMVYLGQEFRIRLAGQFWLRTSW